MIVLEILNVLLEFLECGFIQLCDAGVYELHALGTSALLIDSTIHSTARNGQIANL
jgi:hypothetical protein